MDVQSVTSSSSVNVINGCPVLCSTEYGSTDSSPAGEHGSCTDDPVGLNTEDEVSSNQEVANTVDAPSSSVRPSSPDLNCPICLGRLENRSYTDTCFHKFCFVCLVEWSKVKPVCPLCKQPFTSVIHNVQSYENFEQLPITPGSGAAAVAADSNRSLFRYPTTVIRGSSERRRQRDSLQRPSRLRQRGSSRFDVRPPAFTSSFRRSIYRDELWVRSVDDSSRYRDASAAFFALNPAAVHRLMPWLNRELMALLRNTADVAFLLDVILSTVQRVDIISETFYDLVAPFLGARTRHFVHEFHTFARSPFNMEAYDTRAVYEHPVQIASTAPIEFSDSSSSDSSDAEIVEISPLIPASESNLAVADDEHAMDESIFDLGESVDSADRTASSPQPGPSHVQDIPLPEPLHQSLQYPTPSSSGRQNLGINMDNTDEDSEGDIEIVAEDKPWGKRSPVVLSSSDTDGDNEIEQLHEATNINSTVNNSTVETQLSADFSQDFCPILQHRTVDTGSSDHSMTDLVHSNEEKKWAEAKISSSASSSTHGLKKSLHRSKRHRHKSIKKHKHRHQRDSSHHQKHIDESQSSSASHRKKHKRCSERCQFADDKLNYKASSTVTETVPGSCRVDNLQAWMSDDSFDNDDHQRVRSVVVVPQAFKKNSSGHKHSKRDSI